MTESRYNEFVESFQKGGPIELPNGLNVSGPIKDVQGDTIQCEFNTTPITVAKLGAGAATGTDGDENLCTIDDCTWEIHVIGTQTIDSGSLGTYGLNIVQDETDDEGIEYCLGINANNKGVFTVGTSPAFYAKLKYYISVVAGTDDCAFGFRKVEDYQKALDDYDEMASLNTISGNITIETILNDGNTTTTDTTDDWADAEIHELAVYVSAAGVVTYKIDGMPPSTTAAFTFDDAEVVVPFFYQLGATTPAAAVEMISFECGLQ